MAVRIVSRQPLTKGWSTDQKYKVQLEDGRLGLLRIAERPAYEAKQLEFQLVENLFGLGLPVAEPLSFWADDLSVYTLYEWMEGQDMNDLATSLSEQTLYELGCQSGKFLRTLHALPIDQSLRDWNSFYQAKIDNKLAAYQAASHSYPNGQAMIAFVQANRHLLEGRPIAYHHGDFHTGNFLRGQDGRLKILDFDRYDIGDPWEEFNRLIFTADLSPAFARGQVDVYFDGAIPEEFWKLMALYVTVNSLGALSWAEQVDSEQIPLMKLQAQKISEWYEYFNHHLPKWYM
ncbi:TPA: phosphotransferase [Streptococcus suis]|uniref:Phosphotransferase enzyme family protein n=5 Tax=Streptococcus suis TaxID=1307 RepID=A0A0H3N1W7_STRS4|nr:phosphotransferase [Streptococcus suis]ABP90955.1 Predicted aminoglycoside phosphotransferase [Streptococcus suis 05ZYH33]ABP93152.1 Predicted aminoglycoside phosphotransferase [Streptococcus suis 98HAH33]ADE32261.1 Aminoglycoside phosphotransferase [Streptococcus suis GZ1]ADV70999.1 aminoglycoside phosphotransferase [Streptococcus suis JS14]AER45128.1 aminoglycoside phosphotransferase [Streptococcus suis A7]